MKVVVADASFCGAWIFRDEATQEATRFLEELLTGMKTLLVPSLWYYEMANMLRSGFRRGRLNEERMQAAENALARVPLKQVDLPGQMERKRILKLAIQFELSAYDAAYLELSDRLKVPLLTLDKGLAEASASLTR